MTHDAELYRHPSVFVDDGGTGGTPIIFLHAFGGSSSQWWKQLDFIRASGRAIAFDFPAHGSSPPVVDGDYSIAALANCVADVVDDLELRSVMLVGHSIGGAAAIAFAGSHPDRVAALIVEEAPGKLPDEQVREMRKALDANYDATMQQIWTRLLTNAEPATKKLVQNDARRVPVDAARALIDATFSYDPLPDLARYAGPTLSITGPSGDVPNALHRVAPNVLHQEIAGTSHWIQLDQPHAFNAVLMEFVEQRVR